MAHVVENLKHKRKRLPIPIHIPPELIGVFFSYLEHADAARLSRISKTWRYAYRNTSILRHLNILNDMMCYLSLTHRQTLQSLYVTGVNQPELRICRYPRKIFFSHSVLQIFPLSPQPAVEELTLHESICERIEWKYLPNLKFMFVIGNRRYSSHHHPPHIDLTVLTSVDTDRLRDGSFDLSCIFTSQTQINMGLFDTIEDEIFDIEDTDLYNFPTTDTLAR
jgi:hypothetical protein